MYLEINRVEFYINNLRFFNIIMMCLNPYKAKNILFLTSKGKVPHKIAYKITPQLHISTLLP